MNEPTIVCPTCGSEILLTETLARPYVEAERNRIDTEARERAAVMEKRESEIRLKDANLREVERSLNARANDIENEIEARLRSERPVIAAEEADKAKNRHDT